MPDLAFDRIRIRRTTPPGTAPDLGPAPRVDVVYHCPHDHTQTVTMSTDVLADGATPPAVWTCRAHGTDMVLETGPRALHAPGRRAERTPLVMLLERRTQAELEQLLSQRLQALRDGSAISCDEYLRSKAGHRNDDRARP